VRVRPLRRTVNLVRPISRNIRPFAPFRAKAFVKFHRRSAASAAHVTGFLQTVLSKVTREPAQIRCAPSCAGSLPIESYRLRLRTCVRRVTLSRWGDPWRALLAGSTPLDENTWRGWRDSRRQSDRQGVHVVVNDRARRNVATALVVPVGPIPMGRRLAERNYIPSQLLSSFHLAEA
jgi:hypothetical protein